MSLEDIDKMDRDELIVSGLIVATRRLMEWVEAFEVWPVHHPLTEDRKTLDLAMARCAIAMTRNHFRERKEAAK